MAGVGLLPKEGRAGGHWGAGSVLTSQGAGPGGQHRVVITGSVDSPRQSEMMNEVLGLSKVFSEEQQETGLETGLMAHLRSMEEIRLEESYLLCRSEAHPQNETRGRTKGTSVYNTAQARTGCWSLGSNGAPGPWAESVGGGPR